MLHVSTWWIFSNAVLLFSGGIYDSYDACNILNCDPNNKFNPNKDEFFEILYYAIETKNCVGLMTTNVRCLILISYFKIEIIQLKQNFLAKKL